MLLLHNKKSTLTSWVDMEEQWEMEQQCEMLEEKCYKLNNCLYTAGCHVTPAQQEKHPD